MSGIEIWVSRMNAAKTVAELEAVGRSIAAVTLSFHPATVEAMREHYKSRAQMLLAPGLNLHVSDSFVIVHNTSTGIVTQDVPAGADVEDIEIPDVVLNHAMSVGEQFNFLFNRTSYLETTKNEALVGHLMSAKVRAICWKLFLGALPEDKTEWRLATTVARSVSEKTRQQVCG